MGGGLTFAGWPDVVEAPASTSLTVESAFTFSAWIRPSAWGGWLWEQFPISGDKLYALALNSDGTLAGAMYTNSGADYWDLTTARTVSLNTWSHVAMTYDGAHLRIYIGGVEVAAREASGNLSTSSEPVRLGNSLTATLDEVRIYTRALTSAELTLDMGTPVDTAAPFFVSRATPGDYSVGRRVTPVSATFSRAITGSTVTDETFELLDGSYLALPSTVTYDAGTRTATLTPIVELAPLTQYVARIVGGGDGIQDDTDNALDADLYWPFWTASSPGDPVAIYALSDEGGLTATDESGNGNAGTVSGPTWSTGRVGGGLVFAGWPDVTQVPASETLDVDEAFTFAAWVRPTARPGSLWEQRPTVGNATYSLALNGDGNAAGSMYTNNGADYWDLTTAQVVPLNAWTHVAMTYDGAHLRIYINGNEVANREASGTLPTSPQPVSFGRSLTGTLDEVRVYRRALTSAEVVLDMVTPADRPITCTFDVTPSSISGAATSQSGLIGVRANHPSCGWTSTSRATWLTLDEPINGYAGSVLADTPAGYWRFDDESAATVVDATGHGLTGSGNSGADADEEGALDGSMTFDGTSGRIDVASDSRLNFTTAMTIEAWFKTSGSGNWQRLFGKGSNGSEWDLWLNSSGVLLVQLGTASGVTGLYGTTVVNDDTWHHVAAVFDGARVALYLDGYLERESALTGTLSTSTSTALTFGRDPLGYFFAGSLDEVAVYNYALTGAQIALHYRAAFDAGVSGSGIVAYTIAANTIGASRATTAAVAGATIGVTQAGGSVPTVAIALTSPFDGTTFNSPTSIALTASVSIASGTVTQVDFLAGATVLGTSTTAPYAYTWTSISPGTYSLTAVVTDSAARTLTSAPVTITVTSATGDFGTLGTPTANPGGGYLGANASVELSAASGASIRYTTDGSSPSTASSLYTGALSITSATVVKAKAFATGWSPSDVMTATYDIDTTGPIVAIAVTPAVSASGWARKGAQVTFTCSDAASGIAVCPDAVPLFTEGADQTVSGTAIDATGNEASDSITVDVDVTAPVITFPTAQTLITTGASVYSLSAGVSDALSGIARATCNGVTATISSGAVTCSTALEPGLNQLVVAAFDGAGNTTSRGWRSNVRAARRRRRSARRACRCSSGSRGR